MRAAFPELGRYIGPPCYIRAGISTPICTEGSHFCGVKVWLDFPEYPAPNMRVAEPGTAMFYFAGWLLGGISMGIAMYLDAIANGDSRYAVAFVPGVLLYSLLALFFGGPFLLSGAFVLRRVTKSLEVTSPFVWAAIGAALGLFLLFAFSAMFLGFRNASGPAIYGTSARNLHSLLEGNRRWPVIPAGAIAAFVLCYVDRHLATKNQIQTTV